MVVLDAFTTPDASAARLAELRAFLVEAFAGHFTESDWEHTLGGRHVVATEDGALVGHAAVVPRSLTAQDRPWRTGYVEGVATASVVRGRGIGSLVMHSAAELLRGRFELGALSTGRHSFYERLGWERWAGPTFVRAGTRATRTEADDDGVMVLRFGPSRTLDVSAPLSCEARTGDAW